MFYKMILVQFFVLIFFKIIFYINLIIKSLDLCFISNLTIKSAIIKLVFDTELTFLKLQINRFLKLICNILLNSKRLKYLLICEFLFTLSLRLFALWSWKWPCRSRQSTLQLLPRLSLKISPNWDIIYFWVFLYKRLPHFRFQEIVRWL